MPFRAELACHSFDLRLVEAAADHIQEHFHPFTSEAGISRLDDDKIIEEDVNPGFIECPGQDADITG